MITVGRVLHALCGEYRSDEFQQQKLQPASLAQVTSENWREISLLMTPVYLIHNIYDKERSFQFQ